MPSVKLVKVKVDVFMPSVKTSRDSATYATSSMLLEHYAFTLVKVERQQQRPKLHGQGSCKLRPDPAQR